ncbi:MAG: SCO family protein [Candidatus Binatia bacterium]|nr:SCO family protein [Candidatus Binatia bacterium]
MTLSRWQRLLALAFFLVSVAVPLVVGLKRIREWMQPPPPVLGQLPEFSLVNARGKPFGSVDLRNRVWVANFIFTRCRGVCPALTEHLRWFADNCEAARAVELVSFSVDPRHDTPEVLQRYAEERGAVTPRWSFLTGDRDAVYGLVTNGFRLAVQENNARAEEPIVHSERFVLVGRNLEIRGYYHGLDRDALRQLCRDAGRLARQ